MAANFLYYEVVEDKSQPGDYRAWAVDTDGDGKVYVATFTGPDAEGRAEEYAEWKNADRLLLLKAS